MPERALMSPSDVAGFRTAFETIDRLWGETMTRAREVRSATPFLTDAGGLTVADCLRVVLNEEWEHRLYAERDLAVLAGGGDR